MSSWRAFRALLLLLSAAACQAYNVEKRTRLGLIRGNKLSVLGKEVEEFRGIPYAAPPVGARRFLPPLPATPWEGTLDATSRRTGCPQLMLSTIMTGDIEYKEDCLHLNVWNPASRQDDGVPVLAWIHGGGFNFGSASYDNYTGAATAASTGLVVVSFNYRLGALGFLNAESPQAPGNMGLLDQNLALRWVQENIAEFGGDPSRVTLFGQSAGAMSVHGHVLSPLSRGLFSKAVMLSGTLQTPDFVDAAHESINKGDAVATIVGCAGVDRSLASHPEEVIECLRKREADEIVLATSEAFASRLFPFLPTFHDEFLPRVPRVAIEKGFFKAVDILMGVTEDEGVLSLIVPMREDLLPDDLNSLESNFFQRSLHSVVCSWLKGEVKDMVAKYVGDAPDTSSLRRQYVDYLSDSVFNCPMHLAAKHHSNRDRSVYSYVFGHMSSKATLPSWMRTPHAFEMNYLFGTPLVDKERFNTQDVAVSRMMLHLLRTFATTGVPELPNGKQWPRYTRENPVSVYLDHDNVTDIVGFRKEQCEAWRIYL